MQNRISSNDKSLSHNGKRNRLIAKVKKLPAPASSSNGKRKLSKEHLAELKDDSGLSLDTITKAGIYTESNPDTIASLLGNPAYLNGHLQNSSAMVIPFGYDDFARVKLSDPRLRNGKPIKYESPFGSIQHPYFPPGVQDAINQSDDTREVFLVEGEKKALKLWQDFKDNDDYGHVIGLTGVWGWKKKQQEQLIDWLESIHWTNRNVLICFDNDAHWNKNVSDARRRLARILKGKGANVKKVDIPITDPSQKYGVDDYIHKFGILSYADCIVNAKAFDQRELSNPIYQCDILTSQELFQLTPPKFLIDGILQEAPMVIGGPMKCMKTQLALDMAASLASGKPCLGMFEVKQTMPVLYCYCEPTNLQHLQQPWRNILLAKGMPRSENGVFFSKYVMQFGTLESMEAIANEAKEIGARVIFIDPSYRSFPNVEMQNVFLSGAVLATACDYFMSRDLILVCCHHFNRSVKVGDKPTLSDLAYTGFAEVIRSWVLVNHRVPFDTDGKVAKLWLETGGSGYATSSNLVIVARQDKYEVTCNIREDAPKDPVKDDAKWQEGKRIIAKTPNQRINITAFRKALKIGSNDLINRWVREGKLGDNREGQERFLYLPKDLP